MNNIIFNDRVINPNNTLNWGDLIPFKIIKELSDSEKVEYGDVFNVKKPINTYKIYSTGSVMAFTGSDSIVWGTGCIQPKAIGLTPKKIYSVRGPETRKQLEYKGITCPEIYGDPALLFPKIYNPKNIEKKYKYGIIPHYIEYSTPLGLATIKNLENLGFKIINICSGETEFIDELLEVEYVISSTLHGLIAADAYGIPNARVNITNKLIGGHFKFVDYFRSVKREIDFGLQLTPNTKIEEIINLNFNGEIVFDCDDYINNSAPWINNEYKLF